MAIPASDREMIPGSIGPYRVKRRLARGGMGEVYAGYDERLDRPVALKRVRPGVSDTRKARRRFRDEGRSLARLQHPAIVQVYDWVETRDSDWIVMELVPGRSLRRVLEDGPLAPERAAALAKDLLEGLTVAHEAGVVHRDLKAENIMVAARRGSGTPTEQAKILDFGLAKIHDLWSPESHPPDASASPRSGDIRGPAGGPLSGTFSAMSPEQALGRPVDPRSDLFSLGSLLYEMTTGVSPFHGGTPEEILRRICTFKPPSPRTLAADVPQAFASFILHLLEKDLRRRPRSAAEALTELATGRAAAAGGDDPELENETRFSVSSAAEARRGARWPRSWLDRRGARRGAALVALALAMAFTTLMLRWREPPRPRYIAVPPTAVLSSEPVGQSLELAAAAVHTALLRGLLGFRGLAAVEPAGNEAELGDPVALAAALAADEVLSSRLRCTAHICHVVLERRQGSDGRVLWAQGISVGTDRFLELSLAVDSHLAGAYPEAARRPGAPELRVRAEDYTAYLRLLRRFDRRGDGASIDGILAELASLARTSPRFVALTLFEALVLLRRFEEERDPEDLARARRSLERARTIAPEYPLVWIRQVQVELAGGRLEAAQAASEALGRLQPGDAWQRMQQADLLAAKGESKRAIAIAREVVEHLPSASNHFYLADMLYRRGDVEEARRYLEAGLERSPTHYDGRSRLAQLELLYGSPERAAELYRELLGESASATELGNLGTAYLLLGQREEAARCFRRALALAPRSSALTLNLADAELLLGREEIAFALYRRALELIDEDPHPEALLGARAQALAQLGQAQEAVAAVQEALQLMPEHPGIAYEAALAYVLLGDEASALWHARRALELGVAPGWLTFPWFAPIRPRIDELQAREESED